jgi:asparagine synthase (glutamine-hydrolysing)
VLLTTTSAPATDRRSSFAFHVNGNRRDLGWAEDADGNVVIVDGEVFELPGSSTPVSAKLAAKRVLDLYRKDRADLLASVNCAAAISIWDERKRRLLIARDRGGLGLCYFMERHGALFWSSDMRTLIAADPRSELDHFAIDNLLAGGFVPAPRTCVAHIRKIPAAHMLVADGQGTTLQRYWWPSAEAKRPRGAHSVETLDLLLERAVRRRLPDGQKAAMLLSGGVDSMLLLAYLTRRCGAPLESFTFRYEGYEGVFNEGARARRAAEFCGVPHHEVLVRPHDLARMLDQILWDHHGPMSYAAHTSQLQEIAASGSKLLFGGHAADSFFFSRSEEHGVRLRRQAKPAAALLGLAGAALRRLKPDLARRMAYAARVAQTGLTWRFHSPLTPEPLRSELYAEPALLRNSQRAASALYAAELHDIEQRPECDHIPLVMQRFYTPENALHWIQSFARAHGMVARCPYSDNGLLDHFYSLSRGGGKKDELRAVARRLLPPELASAPKLGQTMPLGQWFRGPLSEFVQERLDPEEIRSVGLFRPHQVQNMVGRHLAGENCTWPIWLLINIVHWHKLVRSVAGTRIMLGAAAE